MNAPTEYKLPFDPEKIFTIQSEEEFDELTLQVFRYQVYRNPIYKAFCRHIHIDIRTIDHYRKIPFLPISFFKTHRVTTFDHSAEAVFKSSGTTGMERSEHHIKDLSIYEQSFMRGFELFYGPPEDYIIIGLLPSYLEQGSSSLVYMVDHLIQASGHTASGFFLNDYEQLNDVLKQSAEKKVLLIGVAYALLDFGEAFHPRFPNLTIIETGGMKGRRKELIKSDLHERLKKLYHLPEIHSEYGMTELLSQAYSVGLQFKSPPWMRVLTRSHTDPFQRVLKKTGGVNIIDLANIHSCSFIATQDLGKSSGDQFEIMGRFDQADVRGCNLLVQ